MRRSTETKESRYIEGPVNFIYLVGDPGDNVTRKILLLGDYHKPRSRCGSNTAMSLIDFFRFVSERVPVTPDLFVESPFHANEEDKNTIMPPFLKEGQYIYNLIFELRDCLTKDKSHCREPMRVHYIDNRLLQENRSTISAIQWYVDKIVEQNYEKLENIEGYEPVWPRDEQEIKTLVLQSLTEGRLTQQKVDTLDPKIRVKFHNSVLFPTLTKLVNFYRNYHRIFGEVKKIAARLIRTNTPLTDDEKDMVIPFRNIIIGKHSYVMDAYFVCRALKRATRHAAERYNTLKTGQAMTHIMGYTGAAHTFGIRNMLLRMGFEVKDHFDTNKREAPPKKRLDESKGINQCLAYSLISNAVNDFCGNEEEEEEEEEEEIRIKIIPFKPGSKSRVNKPVEDEPKLHLKISKSKPRAKWEEEEEELEEEEEELEEEEEEPEEEEEELEEEEEDI